MARVLLKKIFFEADMELLTGLRIGDNKDNVEIGGVDSPVVRRKDNYQPYIPGSSLKGKMRCLLELMNGENFNSKCQNDGGLICQLFGASENTQRTKSYRKKMDGASEEQKAKLEKEMDKYQSSQSRIIFRDAYLTDDSASKLFNSEYTDLPYTEIKWENVINRIRGTAEHPRQLERIPAGAKFRLNFVLNIFKGDDEKALVELFKGGIEALNDDYLGGSGTRGYGQVDIQLKEPKEKTKTDYLPQIEAIAE